MRDLVSDVSRDSGPKEPRAPRRKRRRQPAVPGDLLAEVAGGRGGEALAGAASDVAGEVAGSLGNAGLLAAVEDQEGAAGAVGGDTKHMIQPGESLYGIAKRYYGDASRWHEIYLANQGTIRDANSVNPGQELTIPGVPAKGAAAGSSTPAQAVGTQTGEGAAAGKSEQTYTVQSGDSLSSIAESQLGDGTRWVEIYQLNRAKLPRPNQISAGMKLRLPEKGTDASVGQQPDLKPTGGTSAQEAKQGEKKSGAGARKYDRQKFSAEFEKELGKAPPSALLTLLKSIEADGAVTDVKQVAYMLATVKHETAHTYEAIEEYGKGRGHEYGKKINGKAYYGRGFVQLTWLSNYRRLGKELGIGEKLVEQPELALQSDIAYRIMSAGMRKGLFTGRKLSDYIGGGKADYVNARKIINGLDRAKLIAGYAKKFEKVLTASEAAAADEKAQGDAPPATDAQPKPPTS